MGGLDGVFEAVADERRRRLLYCVQKHGTVAFSDLVKLVAEDIHEDDASALSEDQLNEIELTLHHIHIPKLVDAGLIDHDEDNEFISTGTNLLAALENAEEEIARLQTA